MTLSPILAEIERIKYVNYYGADDSKNLILDLTVKKKWKHEPRAQRDGRASFLICKNIKNLVEEF